MTHHRGYLFSAAAMLALTLLASTQTYIATRNRPPSVQKAIRLLPDKILIPGAIQPVDLTEICSERQKDLDPAVSVSVRKVIFQQYGMNVARDNDYLINPQLGGTHDIRNLSPEPYG